MWNNEAIRLIGVRLDKLIESVNYQVSLFEENNHKDDSKIDNVLDSLKQKYGNKIITKASLKDDNKHYKGL